MEQTRLPFGSAFVRSNRAQINARYCHSYRQQFEFLYALGFLQIFQEKRYRLQKHLRLRVYFH